jgi:hypothetical protein
VKAEGEGYCRRCQKVLNLSYFFETTNPRLDTNGYLSVCKDCCNSIYGEYLTIFGDIGVAIKHTCQDLDIYYSLNALKQTQTQIEGMLSQGKIPSKSFSIYKSKLTSNVKRITKQDDMRYRNSNSNDSDVENILVPVQNRDEIDSIELDYYRIKWGSDLPVDDLIWLNKKYEEWYDSYDISGKSMELLIEQLCFEELFTYKERQTGKDVSKRLNNIQTMLKNSKLSPKQETASEQAEFSTISEFIKKVEQSKPIIKSNPEFEDPDKFKQMWQSIAGAISRTAGKPDENTQVFDEFFADSTMDLSNLYTKD